MLKFFAAPLAFATLEVDDAEAVDISHGRPLRRAVPDDPTALVHGGRLLALYRPASAGAGSGAVPVAVLV